MKLLRKLNAIILLIVILSAQNLSSQTIYQKNEQNIPNEISSNIDSFFKILFTSEYENAFRGLLKNSEISNNKDQVQLLIDEAKNSVVFYGETKGYEFLNSSKLSNSYVRVRYLSLNIKFPIRWEFTFYKSPAKGWIVTKVKFDDEFEDLFKVNEAK